MRDDDSLRETTVQSIERGAAILRMFSVDAPSLSLGEITTRLGRSKATGHRYVSVLRKERLLRLNRSTGMYTLGTATLGMASAAVAGLPVIRLTEPVMAALVQELQETVVLTVWDGDAPVVVRAMNNTSRVVTVNIRTGVRLAKDSAHAHVFHAFGGQGSEPDDVSHEEASRALFQGLSIHTNEGLGIRSVAAPVFLGDELAASMALLGTTATIPDDADSPMAKRLKTVTIEFRDSGRIA